ncbi:MAG: hydroxymethylbilane synthase, partial [Pseudobdellovibrionaceae bacterium]
TELWNGQHHAFFDRQALAIDPENLHRFSGLWISRQDAWPENLQWSGPLWCAGLKTWQALAKKGLWVHGSSESLGENENPNLDILCDEKIHWALLTHDQSADLRTDSKNSLVATYKLIEKTPSKNLLEDLSKHTFFFWNSGSQFQYALKHCPEIKNKHHACGPGHSFDIIRGLLLQHQSYEANKLQVVLEPKDLFV